ncbi:hypothetical protein CKA55_08835 [Arcobacter suis]|uniref:Flagellar hook-length control protein FliK n=1 Tax=Arcobacter suis CECT 7833 TaxID=663365 RepID=A0AAD0ST48_9BACT|nr:flagellar hook-length control protein FliK [Arcobacter suis]AXX90590.1 flagellar hook-length control protein FliK [Arcobacter suis CECT 7833]RWS46295.1 hypothetical protein CKA55_08835 [Arcobacter suis]
MSNIINNLLSSEKTTNTNTASSTSEQTVKDKPSLFDSLLSNSSAVKEEKIINDTTTVTATVKEVKIDEKAVVDSLEASEEIKLENLELESTKVEPEKTEEQKQTSVTSLLDRLILEAKKNLKETTAIPSEINKQNVTKLNNGENITGIIPEEVKQNPDISVIIEENTITNNLGTENISEIIPEEVKQNPNISIIIEENIITNNLGTEIIPEVIPEEVKQNLNTSVPVIPQDNLTTPVIPKENIVTSDTEVKNKEQKVNSTDVLLEQFVVKTQNGVSTEEVVSSVIIPEEESANTILNNNGTILNTDNISNIEENSLLPVETVEENVTKQESVVVKKEEKLSLMDQLILKNNEKLTINTINSDIDTPLKDVVAKDFISSIYLGSQKNKINNQSLFNKNEAISILKDGNSMQAIKTSAEMLDLGLENMDIEQNIDIEKVEIKKTDIDSLTKKNLIDNLFLEKNVKSLDVKNLITQSIEASSALLENSLNLAEDATVNVNSPLSYNIQSRIIGAKQQMSAMMSDIAKQMYENYKPPMTAFRINLNPLELGSIAILMKNDRNSGLTISMNVSNNVTLDTMMENQNMLKNSLNKTFDEGTKFNLDFSSSNQNSDNQSSNSNQGQGNNRRFEQQMDTQSVLQLKEENRDIEEKSIDYM